MPNRGEAEGRPEIDQESRGQEQRRRTVPRIRTMPNHVRPRERGCDRKTDPERERSSSTTPPHGAAYEQCRTGLKPEGACAGDRSRERRSNTTPPRGAAYEQCRT